jgi:aspartyl-tRNA(Asn)/glutamyl-tRNA(Gln) amidotransferase subunit A
MYLSDIFTITANLAAIPALSVPCGFTASGLPIGLQLMGRPFGEVSMLRTAAAYQTQTGHHRRHPPV